MSQLKDVVERVKRQANSSNPDVRNAARAELANMQARNHARTRMGLAELFPGLDTRPGVTTYDARSHARGAK